MEQDAINENEFGFNPAMLPQGMTPDDFMSLPVE